MKKRKVIVSAALVLLVALGTILFTAIPGKISRVKYPYAGSSLLDYSDYSPAVDVIIRDDYTIEEYMNYINYNIIRGKFLTDIDKAPVKEFTLLPETGSAYYEDLKSMADETGQSIESLGTPLSDCVLQFEVEEDLAGIWKKGEVISLNKRIDDNNTTKPQYPDVKTGDKAVLIVYKTNLGVYTTATGFFYIDEHDRVISAEKYPSMDKYTGMNVDEFMDILAGIYKEKGAKPTPEP